MLGANRYIPKVHFIVYPILLYKSTLQILEFLIKILYYKIITRNSAELLQLRGCNGFDCGLKFGEAIREEQRYHSKLNINAEDNLAYAA